MKSNLQYIFDKIIREAGTTDEWEKLDREALIDIAIAIGATDRGVTITPSRASLVAESVIAFRMVGKANLHRLRANLQRDKTD